MKKVLSCQNSKQEFESIKSAAHAIGISNKYLSMMLKGRASNKTKLIYK